MHAQNNCLFLLTQKGKGIENTMRKEDNANGCNEGQQWLNRGRVCFSASFLSHNHMSCTPLSCCYITALPLSPANERRVLPPPPLAAPLPTSFHWNGPMALCPTCVAYLQAAAGACHLIDDKGPVLPLTQHPLSSYFVQMALSKKHCTLGTSVSPLWWLTSRNKSIYG